MSQTAAGQNQTQQNSGQQAQQGQGQQQLQTLSEAAARPDWLPEGFWDKDKNEIKGGDLRKQLDDLTAFKAEQDIRATTLPKSAEDYQVKLPDDFKAPEGIAFEFNKDDPLLAAARTAAHELKLDQGAFSRMLGIYAASKIGEIQVTNAAREKQLQGLGAAAPQRITAAATWVRAAGGPKAETLAATLEKYPVADYVETIEALAKRMSSQGGIPFTQQHRETEQSDGKPSNWDTMTPVDRRTWNLTHPKRPAAA